MNYKLFFESILKEEVSERPRHEAGGDGAVQPFLDKGTNPAALNTEGMPEGAMGSLVEKVAQEIIGYAKDLQSSASRLIDPSNPQAILTRLASPEIGGIPEFASAAEDAAKALEKAQPAIQLAVTKMNTLATLAASRRDARVAKETEAASVQQGPR